MESRKEYLRNYMKKYRKKYAEKNREKIREQRRKWYSEHKEEMKIYQKEWRAKNKDKVKEHCRVRNKRWRKKLTHRKWRYIILLGSSCKTCGIKAIKDNTCIFDFHHINKTDKEKVAEWKYKGFEQKIKEGKIELLCSNCHRLKHFKR